MEKVQAYDNAIVISENPNKSYLAKKEESLITDGCIKSMNSTSFYKNIIEIANSSYVIVRDNSTKIARIYTFNFTESIKKELLELAQTEKFPRCATLTLKEPHVYPHALKSAHK